MFEVIFSMIVDLIGYLTSTILFMGIGAIIIAMLWKFVSKLTSRTVTYPSVNMQIRRAK